MTNNFLNVDDVCKSISIKSGEPKRSKLSLYSIVRNEIFLIRAFLNHYRNLGIEQFLILDDNSNDGTAEFLCEQTDCVILSSSFSYGDEIPIDLGHKKEKQRVGVVMTRAIPERFLMDQYAVYADADEFLFLPTGISSISEIVNILESNRIDCIAASFVEFYPRDLYGLSGEPEIRSLSDLLDHYPYYDARPSITIEKGKYPRRANDLASMRLFRKFGISKHFGRFPKLSLALDRHFPLSYYKYSGYKTPILKWAENTWLKTPHDANVPPSELALLSLGHFKFTHGFEKNIEEAIERKSHSERGKKYVYYALLLQEMKRAGGNFLGPDSRKYENPAELIECGLMKWDL